MRRASGHGFFLSVIINMLFRTWWLVFVAALLVLHFAVGWPLWLIAIPLVCWVLHAVIITLVFSWANNSAEPAPKHENKNPYSNKNSDFIKK